MTNTCTALIVGSARSRKGTNRFEACTAPAKYRVTRVIETGRGTVTHEHHVCGTHVREHRANLEREQSFAALMGTPSNSCTTITEE